MAQHNSPEEIMRDFITRYAGHLAVGLVVIVLLVSFTLTVVFTVPTNSQAVIKRFGKLARTVDPGLHFKLPFSIETATIIPTKRVLKEEFGFRTVEAGRQTEYRSDRSIKERESLMLTGDLNVIDVEWVVQYQIIYPDRWMHRVRDPRESLRDISESVMRRVVGNRLGSEALTVARSEIAEQVKIEMQEILGEDGFNMGVSIGAVEMQDVTPPEPVKPAFNDVNKARQEQQRLINEAQRERNRVIPRARGEAEQTIAEAEAYRAERTNAAKGEAARFESIVAAYKEAPETTRRRMFLEMMDRVLPEIGRIFVLEEGQESPLPLLDLEAAAAGSRATDKKGGLK